MKEIHFTVELEGTTYDCLRVIENSKGYLFQEVAVNGNGRKKDNRPYQQFEIDLMQANAIILAKSIIREVRRI